MILDAIPQDHRNDLVLTALAHSHSFLDDTQWDEVNVIEHDHSDQEEVLRKCAHDFDARICLERTSSIFEPDIVTYVATAFIHNTELAS